MFLESIQRRQQALVAAIKRPDIRELLEHLQGMRKTVEGKTVGVIIPDSLRERLLILKARLDVRTYKQIVLMCVEIGVLMLEIHHQDQKERKTNGN